jgi:hypothetical protein
VEAPAGAGDVHAVFDQVPACVFDHAGRDRPAVGERGGVVQVGSLLEQVVSGAVGVLALVGIEPEAGRFAADRSGGDPGFALEDLPGFVVDPALGGGVALVKETPRGSDDR